MTTEDGRQIVRCYSQDGEDRVDLDVSALALPEALHASLTAALVLRTTPGKGLTSVETMNKAYRALVNFTRYLTGLDVVPQSASELTPDHFDGFYKHRKAGGIRTASNELADLRLVLILARGLNDALAGRLAGALPARPEGEPAHSYSRTELKRIAQAARTMLRTAEKRIRSNRELLEKFRAGEIEVSRDADLRRRLQILDHLDRVGDVPRRMRNTAGLMQNAPETWVTSRGKVREVVGWLYLTPEEIAAAAVLFGVMTGQNPEPIVKMTAAHHRADGGVGPGTAIVGLRKPRRQSRAYMDLALSEVPDWISIPDQPDQMATRDILHTPFGLYVLVHELTVRARQLAGGNRLLVTYMASGGGPGTPKGRGWRPMRTDGALISRLGRDWNLPSDETDKEGNPLPLRPLRLETLRMTYIELHQKPVAHTRRTATRYLVRNRGNINEYRTVVAQALTAEVATARARSKITTMTAEQVAHAQENVDEVAAEMGLEPAVLKRMIAGELDTVLGACTDNNNGSYTPGEPCRASFLLCLGCECARALPRHLPVQVAVHDRLAERREQMGPLEWAERFAGPHAQLADLLDQADEAAVEDVRKAAGPDEHKLADRLLNRELDIR
ncbi:phage integrase N-terminal domain-containing protein [[Kitasatospora] papulosa]|uniref:phage integrase N-terminal domain-containing protein n=1 Tax=[Kitasatospora] papulosa TaxID=1464011 RepID=UPI00368CD351